ncbi:transposase [Kribbella sp. NPDC023972]|uniref:transposase n=1 Tax=Kribbella sp. NPDC023972 TaxID=3154795 RepID=UPI0033DD567E
MPQRRPPRPGPRRGLRPAPRPRHHHQLPRPRRRHRREILAELGDDRNRFIDARAVKAYAGSAPITRASGRSRSITYRRIKNDLQTGQPYDPARAFLRTDDPEHAGSVSGRPPTSVTVAAPIG